MHGRFDAVVHFEVQFWQLVLLVGAGVFDITQRRGVDDVTDNEALDGLVLGDGLAGAHTADALDVSAALFVPSVIASFDGHD